MTCLALLAPLGWAAASEAPATPEDLVRAYVRAFLARDYAAVYALASKADRRLKPEADYLRETESFTGFALEAARGPWPWGGAGPVPWRSPARRRWALLGVPGRPVRGPDTAPRAAGGGGGRGARPRADL